MRTPVLDPTIEPLDTVRGVPNIAKFTGLTERQTYHLLKTGKLPGVKIGGLWIASRQKLRVVLGVEAA